MIGLLLIELIFGGWFNANNQLSNIGILRDVKLEYTVNHLYETDQPTITYTRDSYGLRGISTFNEPSKIDILTVGGSTTDQRYIDDAKTWQEALERALSQEKETWLVSNAGVDGQSTYGHLKSFELWFSNIEKLQPEMIFFYVGINDFYKVSSDAKYDAIQQYEHAGLKNTIKDKSVLYNVYRKLKGIRKAQKVKVGHFKVDFSATKYTQEEVLDSTLLALYDEKNLKAFKVRVQQLIAYSKKMRAIPIFITQPTFLYKIENGEVFGVENINYIEEKYAYNGVGYYKLLTKLNDAIKEAASDFPVIDISSEDDWQPEDFYDYYHMTEAGAAKLGKKIYQKMTQIELVK